MAQFHNLHIQPLNQYQDTQSHFTYNGNHPSILNGIEYSQCPAPATIRFQNLPAQGMQTQAYPQHVSFQMNPLFLKSVNQLRYHQAQETLRLKHFLKQSIDSFHILSFMSRLPWTRELEINFIQNEFAKIQLSQLFPSLRNELILETLHRTVQENPHSYHITEKGDFFKSLKTINGQENLNKRLEHSVIRTTDGQYYQLIYKPSAADKLAIKDKVGFEIVDGSGRINKGGAGSIKFARNLLSDEYVIAKTVKDAVMGQFEWKSFQNITPDPFLFTHTSGAVIPTLKKDGTTQDKFYFFGPFADQGDGIKNVQNFINPLKNIDPGLAQQSINETSLIYTASVASLHDQGKGHRDIKLPNFLHSTLLGTRLADFGVAALLNDKVHVSGAGTNEYCPPEFFTHDYNYISHDSWSTGLVMLELKFSHTVPIPVNFHLEVAGHKITLEFNELNRCKGIPSDHPIYQSIKYETFDEIAAGYLNQDPKQRLTPQQAMTTPFYMGLSQAQYAALMLELQ